MTFAFYNGLTKGSKVRFMREILLVDDNSAITQELAKLLKRRGYGVQTAATVAGAKDVIEKEPPLFISSDLDLPDGSGLELLNMVRAADADLPFLIVSCHDPNKAQQSQQPQEPQLRSDHCKTFRDIQRAFHNKQADGGLPVQDSRSIIFRHNNMGGGLPHAAYCHLRR